MRQLIQVLLLLAISWQSLADKTTDKQLIETAVRDYIESQHQLQPARMDRSLDPLLAKRTYWLDNKGNEFVMQTDKDTMLEVARTYNQDGDKFPNQPRVEISILDLDQRAASVKLQADEWIDYMHLYKNQQGQWKIINVLWQFNDISRHQSHN